MAIIQKNLFSWQMLEELGDLERLQPVIEVLEDERLMRLLEEKRGKGRDDYPVRAMWNSILAGVVYEHDSIESLRRELSRNGDLLGLCGFETIKGKEAVPTSSAYSRFLNKLMKHSGEVEKIFDNLVKALSEELPGYGNRLGIDAKAIDSHAGRKSKKKKKDGRRDLDADTGVKRYWVEKKDGSKWEKIKSWFGYKLHVIADAEYDLPVSFKVTRASRSDMKELKPMVKSLKEKHKNIIEACNTLVADKGYDSTENNKFLWDEYEIKPVIAIRDTWQDDKTRLFEDKVDNIVYDEGGKVYCYDMNTLEKRELTYQGFEKERGCLKYRCPLKAVGLECSAEDKCGNGRSSDYGRIVRIALGKNRRIFTPLARSSYKFKNEYKKRSSIERIFSRLDVSFGFENHYIRGKKKMELRCSLAMIVMLSMALGRIRQNKKEYLRSLVKIPKAA